MAACLKARDARLLADLFEETGADPYYARGTAEECALRFCTSTRRRMARFVSPEGVQVQLHMHHPGLHMVTVVYPSRRHRRSEHLVLSPRTHRALHRRIMIGRSFSI